MDGAAAWETESLATGGSMRTARLRRRKDTDEPGSPLLTAAWRPGRRSALRAAAGGLLVAAFGAGCSPAKPTGKKATPAPGQRRATATTATSAEAIGTTGGVLSFAASSSPPGYDPVVQNSASLSAFISLACNGLMTTRNGVAAFPDPADTTLVPDLAAAAPEQPDSLTCIFRLRSDVRWQVAPPLNGSPITAADVQWHFERALHDDKSTLKAAFAAIDRVEAADETTVSFTLRAPSAPFLPLVAGGSARFILPRELGDAGKLRTQLIGTGPFVLERHEQNVRAVFKRNPIYFKQGAASTRLPYADEVDYLVLPDAAARMQALQSRTAAISGELNPDQWQQLRTSNAYDFDFSEAPGVSGYIYMRLDQPPFDDQRVRQALSLAIDRPAMIQSLGHGRGVADLPVPALLGGQSLPLDRLGAAARFYGRDLQAARQLLAAAGHAGGISTTLSYTAIYGAASVQAVQLLQSSLREAGIEAVPKPLDYAAYLTGPFRGNFDGLAYGQRNIFPDADPYLSTYYLPGALEHQDRSDDATLQGLIVRQQQTLDATARADLLAQIQRYLSEQQYRVYDVAIPRGFARAKQVQNLRATDWAPLSQIESTWIRK